MAETVINPREFIDININHYKYELKRDLRLLGRNKSKLYNYLFVKDYYFGGQKSDLLLFIDIENDRDWQEHVPFVKAIAIGDKVVDGQTIDKRHVKYISNAIYGKCKVATVADFDEDGREDYAIAIVTAFGKGASREKTITQVRHIFLRSPVTAGPERISGPDFSTTVCRSVLFFVLQ